MDPVVFFTLQLVMFFEGIRLERKLIETASLNLAHRYTLGYALGEELPDHSSLTRIRQRRDRHHRGSRVNRGSAIWGIKESAGASVARAAIAWLLPFRSPSDHSGRRRRDERARAH
jgi:hypothetical protein